MSPLCRLNARECLSNPQRKRELNEQIFSVVAPRYDAITRLLSFNRDHVWKDRMVDALPPKTTPTCLDLACGTGDITFRLAAKYPYGRIIGLDLTESMIERAHMRCDAPHIQFLCGDMGRTGLNSESVDIITGGYALRNAGDLREALAEVYRVLKQGGIASFLDFSKPRGRTLQRLEFYLLTFWGSLWGWAFHRNPGVYTYIAESLARFPDRRQLAMMFRAQGFEVQSSSLFFCGIVERITVLKPVPHRTAPPNREPP